MATFIDSTGRIFNWVERTPGSPEEAFAPDRSSAQKLIDITDWTNRNQFCREWIGYSKVLTGSGGKSYIHRVIPQFDPACPNLAGLPYLYAEEVSRIEPIEPTAPFKSLFTITLGGTAEAVYTKARITFRYTSRLYDLVIDTLLPHDNDGNPDESTGARYLVREYKPQVEYLSMPQGGFNWVTGTHNVGIPLAAGLTANSVAQGTGKIISAVNCIFTWFNVPAAAVPTKLIQGGPNLALDTARGRVNIDTFLNMPPETFLLQSFDIKPQVSPFGDRVYQVQLLGKYFEPEPGIGHNHIYDPRAGNPAGSAAGWFEVTTNGSTNLVAQADSFSIYDWAKMRPCLRCPGTTQ